MLEDGRKFKKLILKHRVPKKYRIKEIEKFISKSWTKKEYKNMKRAKLKNIPVPEVYHMDLNNKILYIEYLENYKTL